LNLPRRRHEQLRQALDAVDNVLCVAIVPRKIDLLPSRRLAGLTCPDKAQTTRRGEPCRHRMASSP